MRDFIAQIEHIGSMTSCDILSFCLISAIMVGMTIVTKILPYIQIALSVMLIMSIILQQSGAGLGGALGGSDNTTYYTKRGFEKALFYATIIIAILFIASTIIAVLKH